ncbi:GTP-binding protein DRG2 (ODN superfamily) [Pseudoloma neurophilia]|uniref:GTP-binding protein DRG2 (ODN superfamily) n=1 Tax=Pseudoloma neurophilia TaxID=146866 RepID=A0A0R0M5G4_9MICR|nr:GTP-binding protein DRG2 (ODN superfamily) [Pseudoloma neurophilia]
MSVHDKIKEIEQEMARTQKNKATERHIGHLKARISRLRMSLEQPAAVAVKQEGFEVKRSGDARISLVGFPSVGKSTLFNLLTNNKSKTAEHAFTTIDCISGQIVHNNAVLQILDLPGIIIDASKNKGRGKQVISVARTSDLILIVVNKPEEIEKIIFELNELNIRLNKKKKDIKIEQTSIGGIQINDIANNNLEMIRSILKEFKLNNCLVNINEPITDENLIDEITERAVYIPALIVFNKIDNLSIDQLNDLYKKYSSHDIFEQDFGSESHNLDENDRESLKSKNRIQFIPVSSVKNWGIPNLLSTMWSTLDLIRIYTKKKGKFPDLTDPVILKAKTEKNTVRSLCQKLHKDFLANFKGCLVWGRSVKFLPQKVGLSHQLQDEDVVQIYLG